VPGITFILHHNKIIVECNEDGFKRENVEAICQVGNSNKGEGSTGEKGLGFKSVFMVASKVHIESEGYSFSFSYKKGEKELQKLTPKYEKSDDPPDGLTRITLFLVDDESHKSEALKIFREVPATLLLFLRKIKKLTIINNLEDGAPASITYAYQKESEFLTRSSTHAQAQSIFTSQKGPCRAFRRMRTGRIQTRRSSLPFLSAQTISHRSRNSQMYLHVFPSAMLVLGFM
jgi:hypothetical protein